MKKIVLLFSSLFLICLNLELKAQEIHRTNTDFSDYIPLLESAGYKAFSFDISSLKNDTYTITFIKREYAFGKIVNEEQTDKQIFKSRNRTMISDFPEESQKQIKTGEFDCYDLENGIFSLAKKMSIGFFPSKTDSLKSVKITVENMSEISFSLTLKPLTVPGYDKRYSYDIRPFTLDKFTLEKFTPLLLIGSFWYDEDFGVTRFCGEGEFESDMTSETLYLIPHYYVLGIKVKKK